MCEVLNAIMTKMKKLRRAIVDGHIKQQIMEDKIFALEIEKIKRERVEEMEVESQVQACQVQLEPTPIDAVKSNKRLLQEIEDQIDLLFRMENFLKVENF